MWNAGLDESQAAIKIARSNISSFRYADDTTVMAENTEELKSLLMKVRQESEKAGLKLNIQKTKLMAFRPTTSWQIEGEKQILFSWVPKSLQIVTAAMKLKMLAPWKKNYNKTRQCIKKQRHCFADKGLCSQSYVFPVVMYGCECWTIKNTEHWRIDAFKLWWWRRILRVPWIAKRWNQSILKKINPEYSLKELMLKLNSNTLDTRCIEPTHWKRPWCWGRLRRGGGVTEDEMVGWHHQLKGHECD